MTADLVDRPTLATVRLTLPKDPTTPGPDADAEREAWTWLLTSGLRNRALEVGGSGITEQAETAFYAESDHELAVRRDRENRGAEDDGREPVELSRVYFAWAEATIVWPEPSPDGEAVLVPHGWVDLGERGWVATTKNPAHHDVREWQGRLVWLDGVRYRVTGTERFMVGGIQGKGSDMGLLVRPEQGGDVA